jgi:two-component system, LuxR family, response regulator FixJ
MSAMESVAGGLSTAGRGTVFVVDDDPSLRRSTAWLLEGGGMAVETFSCGEAFLQTCSAQSSGCVLLDVRLPGISGIALQEELQLRGIDLPVIMLTGYSEVSVAVRALQQGAFDFIEKPFHDEQLLSCVAQALALDQHRRRIHRDRADAIERIGRLSPREREVLEGIVSGKANKVIAFDLDIAEKTVESHRARVMQKVGVGTLAELVRLHVRAFGDPPSAERVHAVDA